MEWIIEGHRPWDDGGSAACGSPYDALAAAVVAMAAKDYIKILRRLWKKGLVPEKRLSLLGKKAEVEDFLYSGWYEMLTDIGPDTLLGYCRRAAEEQEKQSIRRQNRKRVQAMMPGAQKPGTDLGEHQSDKPDRSNKPGHKYETEEDTK